MDGVKSKLVSFIFKFSFGVNFDLNILNHHSVLCTVSMSVVVSLYRDNACFKNGEVKTFEIELLIITLTHFNSLFSASLHVNYLSYL